MMAAPKIDFVYFGTPAVAAETLRRLIERGLVPKAVVTAPDAPKGRGLVMTPPETKVVAEVNGIPVLAPETLDASAIESIRALGADFAVVVAYGKIFPDELIAAFPKGAINVHYSLLPKYRGATPMEAALLAGDTETGVTIQKLDRELDAGDILVQRTVPIEPTETARELRPRLIALGAEMLVELLPRFAGGDVTPTPQDHAQATRARKFKKADGELDLSAPADENWRKYRAYADTIGTYFFKDGVRYKITDASFENGYFTINRVIPEGKREMDYHS